MLPLRAGSHHSEADGSEEPEETDDQDIQGAEENPVDVLVELSGCPVNAEAGGENGEIQGGVVVVHIRYTAHGDEGEVVQEPTNDRVETGVVDLVNVGGLQVRVAALPADEIPEDHETKDA